MFINWGVYKQKNDPPKRNEFLFDGFSYVKMIPYVAATFWNGFLKYGLRFSNMKYYLYTTNRIPSCDCRTCTGSFVTLIAHKQF